MAARVPEAQKGTVPDYDRAYDSGKVSPLIDGVKGKSESQARSALEKAGYKVRTTEVPAPGVGYGKVVRVITGPSGAKKGAEVTLQLSDGSASDSSDSASTNPIVWDSNSGSPSAPSGGEPGGGQSEPLFTQEDVDRFMNDVRSFFGL